MSGQTTYEVVGVFDNRDDLERAMEALEGSGIDRSQLSLLGTREAVEGGLGLPMREVPAGPKEEADHAAADREAAPRQEPLKRDETGSLAGMMAGLPAYAGATLAAGVAAAATGGAAAPLVVAALAGAAGGGALGGFAASAFNESVDAAYEEQLKAGGIVLVVSLKHPGEAGAAKRALAEHAARNVETQVVTGG